MENRWTMSYGGTLCHYGRKGMKRGMNIFNPDYKPIGQVALDVDPNNKQWRDSVAEARVKAGKRAAGESYRPLPKQTTGSAMRGVGTRAGQGLRNIGSGILKDVHSYRDTGKVSFEGTGKAIRGFGGVMERSAGELREGVKNDADRFSGYAQKAWEGAKNGASTAFGSAKEAAKRTVKTVTKTVSSLTSRAKDYGKRFIDGIKVGAKFVKDVAGTAAKWVKDSFESVKTGIKQGINYGKTEYGTRKHASAAEYGESSKDGRYRDTKDSVKSGIREGAKAYKDAQRGTNSTAGEGFRTAASNARDGYKKIRNGR